MRRSISAFALIAVLAGAPGFSQQETAQAPPIPMPSDRVADSYRIYAKLIPLGETAGKDWPHDLWLIQDTTLTVVQPGQPCSPESGSVSDAFGMNPHLAVHPPESRAQDFLEIMRDFDAHCHERARLDPQAWNLNAPVHLLNPQEQEQFQEYRSAREPEPTAAARFKGAPALYGFSEVYFNASHTVAMVYATHWCGGLCGQGFWVVFGLDKGDWTPLNWSVSSWIS
ncbi:MAG: hypothetical protein ABSF53_24355 [Terracidiphilus sp.]